MSVLIRQPSGFEGVGAIAKELYGAYLSISDRDELEVVDRERDTAFPAAAALAGWDQHAIPRRLDELVRLGRFIHRVSDVLSPANELWNAPKVLWKVQERPLVNVANAETALASQKGRPAEAGRS